MVSIMEPIYIHAVTIKALTIYIIWVWMVYFDNYNWMVIVIAMAMIFYKINLFEKFCLIYNYDIDNWLTNESYEYQYLLVFDHWWVISIMLSNFNILLHLNTWNLARNDGEKNFKTTLIISKLFSYWSPISLFFISTKELKTGTKVYEIKVKTCKNFLRSLVVIGQRRRLQSVWSTQINPDKHKETLAFRVVLHG